ncbi:vWA domain-containing protein [Nocardia vinacea]|uniref:vWA domain-containing protein n=1 Tax=Nocardia vinacea TaxID=96468 RepID=UPI0034021095
MTGVIDSSSHQLVVVPSGGPIAGIRIGLPAGTAGGPGLLQVRAGQDLVQAAVVAVELAEVPPGHVAMADEFASAWDIDGSADHASWRFNSMNPQAVRRIVLELPTELDPVDAARGIVNARLAGSLLWVPDEGAELFVPVDGVPHRVREIDLGGPRTGLACLTTSTAVELYASSVRAGVDIVVLADVSNSMTVDDIPSGMESPRRFGAQQSWITRIDALKRALHELLDIRLQVSGRVSRLALLEFNQQVRHKFPRGGGMAQLDGSSPEELVTEFRHAVALLRPDGGTDIGNALHEAANLLYQHGRSGNEKLIVLVSDGANWTPKGDQGTGEVVHTVQEPVSLVAHLHRDVGIRLHAIGISTAELFHRRAAYEPHETIVPNHALLEELVKVGGGDPTTVGGLDVLADYFAGLGGGMTHRVGERLTEPSRTGPLPEQTIAALDRLRTTGAIEWDLRRDELRSLLCDLVKKCNDEGNRIYGQLAWSELHLHQLMSREFGQPISDPKMFVGSVARVLRGKRSEPPFAPLQSFLDRLEKTDAEYTALTGMVGAVVDSPSSAQVLVMQRVHDLISEMHSTLAAMQPVVSAEPEQSTNPPTKSRFTYRD